MQNTDTETEVVTNGTPDLSLMPKNLWNMLTALFLMQTDE